MLPGDEEQQGHGATAAADGVEDAKKLGLGGGIWGVQGFLALLGVWVICESKQQPQEGEIPFYVHKNIAMEM